MGKRVVSIIIPVYNGEKYLIETLESVGKQSFKDYEVILIEDCSKDNSLKIIKDYIRGNKNYILIENKINQGIIKNIEEGIEVAKGKFILNLGQDDILEESHLEVLLKEFDDKTSFIYCNSNIIDNKGNKTGILLGEKENMLNLNGYQNRFAKMNFINSCGLIYRRNYAIKSQGFKVNYEFRNYGEWMAWIKLSKFGDIKYSNKIRSNYRRHETNITNTFSELPTKLQLLKYYKSCIAEALKTYKFTSIDTLKIKLEILKLEIKYMILLVFPNSIIKVILFLYKKLKEVK